MHPRSLAAIFALATAVAQPIVQVDAAPEIFAVGDIHADSNRLVALLAGAHIIARDPIRWTAGKSVLVFTGDYLDKGPSGPAVLALIRDLTQAAFSSGGRVIVLMGNHEAEFLAAHRDHAFLRTLPVGARVNNWFFAHAGNTAGRTVEQLAAALRDPAALTVPDSILEARLGGAKANGHPWLKDERQLAAYSTALGADHIVQGHQHGEVLFPDGAIRNTGELFQWKGRLFLIDVGMSREIDDSDGAVLHITRDRATAICHDGTETPIWTASDPHASGKAMPRRSEGTRE